MQTAASEGMICAFTCYLGYSGMSMRHINLQLPSDAAQILAIIGLINGSLPNCLTHLPLDNMAAILADDNWKCIFWNEKLYILIQLSLFLRVQLTITQNWFR